MSRNPSKIQSKTQSRVQTNPRYREFKQVIFTAGDEEQFQSFRDKENGNPCRKAEIIGDNIFNDLNFSFWDGYKNLDGTCITNTFRYIFDKLKKGIFVRIKSNKLTTFLPFSKHDFTNEWGDRIKVDPSKYKSIVDFMRYISNMEGRRFDSRKVNRDTYKWYSNNCLLRYEFPVFEGDRNLLTIKDMLTQLCESRKVPDIEFFMNRRDFPLLTRDWTEPYYNIWDSKEKELISHRYDKYAPILSMSSSSHYADIPIPTYDDWGGTTEEDPQYVWEDKKGVAVFRGGTTGCGVDVDSNQRLKVCLISLENSEIVDAGITKWNLRPRKIMGEQYLKTVVKDARFSKQPLDIEEQSKYKYIIHIDGHVAAFRLTKELKSGSTVLKVDSYEGWKVWYSDMLEPYKHYIPIKADLSDLVDKIEWCRENDETCKNIAENAVEFYNKYLKKNSILDYLQKLLTELKKSVGNYIYNYISPLDSQINEERLLLNKPYPTSSDPIYFYNIPNMGRSYGFLKGIHYLVNATTSNFNFEDVAKKEEEIFKNKLGTIYKWDIKNFKFAVKSTNDSKKIKEHIHEIFVGVKCTNYLSQKIPNFVYIFGGYGKNNNVVIEYIHGITLFEYLKSDKFNFDEYLGILVQLCLALEVAQRSCGFVHYDLVPWNIMLQRLKNPVSFDYVISHDKVIRLKTNLIPVIIDYGKSHVIHNKIHHGFINMYRTSTIQDVITVLLKTIKQILSDQKLSKQDFSKLIRLSNFISGTGYRKSEFKSAKDLNSFLNKNTKYFELTHNNKHELESKTPLDFLNFLMTKFKPRVHLENVNEYISIMDRGNGRQVFEYILSSTDIERANTFKDVFYRVKSCTLPISKNVLFNYYAARELEGNLTSVRDDMIAFLKRAKIDVTPYIDIADDVLKFLKSVYSQGLTKPISYNISTFSNTLIQAPYNEETFLVPSEIYDLITVDDSEDVVTYKNMIESVFLVKRGSDYNMSSETKEYYLNVLKDLFSINNVAVMNNTANSITLLNTAKRIYEHNLRELDDSGDLECDSIDFYRKIVSIE